jgi:hypothetical protein
LNIYYFENDLTQKDICDMVLSGKYIILAIYSSDDILSYTFAPSYRNASGIVFDSGSQPSTNNMMVYLYVSLMSSSTSKYCSIYESHNYTVPQATSTNNGKFLSIVSGAYSLVNAPSHTYSTTEQVVGKWVDGSDLYEITLQFTSTSTADTLTSVAHSIANVDVIYVEKAFVVGSSYTQEMAPVGGLTGNDWFQGSVSTTSFDYQAGNDFVSCPVYVVLRYTKSS